MKLLKTKIWHWYDISLLKIGVLLFGMILGSFFHEFVVQYVWVILVAAVILPVKPAVAYFKD